MFLWYISSFAKLRLMFLFDGFLVWLPHPPTSPPPAPPFMYTYVYICVYVYVYVYVYVFVCTPSHPPSQPPSQPASQPQPESSLRSTRLPRERWPWHGPAAATVAEKEKPKKVVSNHPTNINVKIHPTHIWKKSTPAKQSTAGNIKMLCFSG